MSDPRLELPAREPAKALLAQHPDFLNALLDYLWDREAVLPYDLCYFLRDWTAAAYFHTSPVVQKRLNALADSSKAPE